MRRRRRRILEGPHPPQEIHALHGSVCRMRRHELRLPTRAPRSRLLLFFGGWPSGRRLVDRKFGKRSASLVSSRLPRRGGRVRGGGGPLDSIFAARARSRFPKLLGDRSKLQTPTASRVVTNGSPGCAPESSLLRALPLQEQRSALLTRLFELYKLQCSPDIVVAVALVSSPARYCLLHESDV